MERSRVILVVLIGVLLVEAKQRRELLNSYLETNEVQTKSCARIMDHVYNDHVIATNPPDLKGEWTSGRCEVRPGAEFLLRKYIFMDKLQFELHQFYYRDSDCTDPLYSVVAKGRLYIGEPSWLVPGALDSEYSLTLVSVMPYNQQAADILTQKLKKCDQFENVVLDPKQVYTVYQFMTEDDYDGDSDIIIDRDCNAALDLAFHELQLLRMEVRKKQLEIRKMLFFGDIHTDKEERQFYRPTSYQEPLYFKGTSRCYTCKKILNSDRLNPPMMFHKQQPTEALVGEWFSVKCEVRPIGQFLTRHIIFSASGLWEGHYHHFADQRCHQPLFTVYAKGKYAKKNPSKEILHASYYHITVHGMQVTARDERIVNLLNEDMGGDTCGKIGSWEIGETQDVTSTDGCAMLSLKLPTENLELLKLEKQHHHTVLFLGQLPSSSQKQNTKSQPSTSFQPPLIKCGSTDVLELSIREDTVGVNEPLIARASGAAIPAISLVSVVFILLSSLLLSM